MEECDIIVSAGLFSIFPYPDNPDDMNEVMRYKSKPRDQLEFHTVSAFLHSLGYLLPSPKADIANLLPAMRYESERALLIWTNSIHPSGRSDHNLRRNTSNYSEAEEEV